MTTQAQPWPAQHASGKRVWMVCAGWRCQWREGGFHIAESDACPGDIAVWMQMPMPTEDRMIEGLDVIALGGIPKDVRAQWNELVGVPTPPEG